MIRKTHAVLGILFAASLLAGCQDTCDRTARTVSDLDKAQTLLQQGLNNPAGWAETCKTLAMESDAFRDDADFTRSVADNNYTTHLDGCAEVGYVEYCRGGWVRDPYPYPYASLENYDGTPAALV